MFYRISRGWVSVCPGEKSQRLLWVASESDLPIERLEKLSDQKEYTVGCTFIEWMRSCHLILKSGGSMSQVAYSLLRPVGYMMHGAGPRPHRVARWACGMCTWSGCFMAVRCVSQLLVSNDARYFGYEWLICSVCTIRYCVSVQLVSIFLISAKLNCIIHASSLGHCSCSIIKNFQKWHNKATIHGQWEVGLWSSAACKSEHRSAFCTTEATRLRQLIYYCKCTTFRATRISRLIYIRKCTVFEATLVI